MLVAVSVTRTPRLHIQRDDRFRSRLDLALLLLPILLQPLRLQLLRLGIFLVIVRAEEIDIVVIFLCIYRSGVDGQCGSLRAVRCSCFAWVAGEGGEVGFEGGGVLVPAVGVRVFLDCWGFLGGLEDFYIGLGGTVPFVGCQCFRE